MSGTIDLDEWVQRLEAVAGRQLRERIQQAAVEAALTAQGYAQDNATESPRVRTGTLRRSIAGTVGASGDKVDIRLSAGGRLGGANVPYARIQELGGTVVPRSARWLTIPLGPAKTAAGVARGPARSFPNLRFQPTRDGNALLVDKTTGAPFFALRKRVDIKPKHYLRLAIQKTQAELPALLGEAFVMSMPGVS